MAESQKETEENSFHVVLLPYIFFNPSSPKQTTKNHQQNNYENSSAL